MSNLRRGTRPAGDPDGGPRLRARPRRPHVRRAPTRRPRGHGSNVPNRRPRRRGDRRRPSRHGTATRRTVSPTSRTRTGRRRPFASSPRRCCRRTRSCTPRCWPRTATTRRSRSWRRSAPAYPYRERARGAADARAVPHRPSGRRAAHVLRRPRRDGRRARGRAGQRAAAARGSNPRPGPRSAPDDRRARVQPRCPIVAVESTIVGRVQEQRRISVRDVTRAERGEISGRARRRSGRHRQVGARPLGIGARGGSRATARRPAERTTSTARHRSGRGPNRCAPSIVADAIRRRRRLAVPALRQRLRAAGRRDARATDAGSCSTTCNGPTGRSIELLKFLARAPIGRDG